MNPIIIHIPKTGGTTLIMNLLKTNIPPRPNIYYRHTNNLITGSNNCKELIDNYKKYKNYIICFLREPLERLFSEFCFLRNRNEFISMFNNFPDNFHNYVLSPKTHNQICKFILGINLYDEYNVKEDDYKKIINFFENSNIIYCLLEEYNSSLLAIEYFLKINIDKNIIKYRENLNKIEINKFEWENIKELFKKYNEYDIKLFIFFKNKYKIQSTNISNNQKFNFIDNKYHSLMLYCNPPAERCPITIYNPSSKYVENNKDKLINLNKISRKNINNGKEFAINWLTLFIHINKINININFDNPLDTIKELSFKEIFN